MKWFQQNRALGMFLMGFAICALLAAALSYWRWSVWTDASQRFEQAAAERNRLENLNPFPSAANYRKLQGYLDKYSSELDKFKKALKADVAPAPPLAPNEFQSRLRQAVVATVERARVNNVKLPDKFQLGFDEFTRAMPGTAVTAMLGQELSQIQTLINILLDGKVDSVTSLRRSPLPEERAYSATPTATPGTARRAPVAKPGSTPAASLFERNVVDVTFKAAPAAARRALNEIAASTGQFFIIRTLYVRNEKDKGPPRERGPSPTAAPVTEASVAGATAGPALSFIVGNEHIEVSATIEMLRF